MIEANFKTMTLKKNCTAIAFFCALEDITLANDRAGRKIHYILKQKKYNISVENSHSRYPENTKFVELPRALPPEIPQGHLTTAPDLLLLCFDFNSIMPKNLLKLFH